MSATQFVRPAPVDRVIALVTAAPRDAGDGSTSSDSVLRQRSFRGDRRYGPFRSGVALASGLVTFGLLAPLLRWSSRRQAALPRLNPRHPSLLAPVARAGGPCEVRRITVAFDWRARPMIQDALDRIAGSVDMGTPTGLWQGADRARDLLSSMVAQAVAACFVTQGASPSEAESLFARAVADLNGRYDHDKITLERTQALQSLVANPEEGEGLVVVSILVGSNCALAPLPAAPTRASVAQALQGVLPASPEDLAALEIVWSPSVDQDRLSSAEMAVLYPELVPLAGAEPIGRVACHHCRAVYARELGACPACGSRQAAASTAAGATPYNPAGLTGATPSSAHTLPCPACRRPTPSYEVQCVHCGTRVRS